MVIPAVKFVPDIVYDWTEDVLPSATFPKSVSVPFTVMVGVAADCVT